MKKNLLTIILSVVCGLSIVCSVVSLSVGLSHINDTTINEKVEVIESTLDDLEALDTTLDGKIKALETKVTTLESELAKTNTAIETLEEDVSSLQEAKETLEADITSIKADIESLKAKDTDLEGKITTLETTLNSSVEDVKEWVGTYYVTIDSCEDLEDEIKELITSLDSRVTALETSVNTLNGAVNTLNGAVEALEEKVNQNKEKLDELEIRINCLEGKHVPNPESGITYSLSEDYSECSATRPCIYCEEEFVVESAPIDTSTGYAEFETEGFERQLAFNYINATSMSAEEIKTALTSITSGTITLGSDIDLDSCWEINEGTDITLNLNGKTMRCNFEKALISINTGGKITIEDSAETGLITSSAEYSATILNSGGDLVVNGGNIISDNCSAIAKNSGTTIINGGNIKGIYGVSNPKGTLEIKGGTISSASGICINGSMTINGSPTLVGNYHFSILGYDVSIDLTNYTGTETIFSIEMVNAYTNQITLPEGWYLYKDIDGTIPADGICWDNVIYAIKNEGLN